jgi:hypothetical protein
MTASCFTETACHKCDEGATAIRVNVCTCGKGKGVLSRYLFTLTLKDSVTQSLSHFFHITLNT